MEFRSQTEGSKLYLFLYIKKKLYIYLCEVFFIFLNNLMNFVTVLNSRHCFSKRTTSFYLKKLKIFLLYLFIVSIIS